MEDALRRRVARLGHLVGNTPLLHVRLNYRGTPLSVFAKAEHLNLTGSIKDRMALHVLREGYAFGTLTAGAPIAEATSGNTGISFAALGRALGHPVTIFMPDWMSAERVNLIRSFGATIRLVTPEEGGFLGAIELAEEFGRAEKNAFLPRQFANEQNVAAHERATGPEIDWQLRLEGLEPAAFVAGVGTGGTVMGVGRALRARHPKVRVHPLEPANSPTLRTGHQVGHHRIQGISDEFVPAIVDLDALDDIVSVDDGDAIVMAQRLAAELGLGVGISSGANLLGAVEVAAGIARRGDDGVVATVFPDDNKKYLSTDLMRDEPVKPGWLSPDIELLDFEPIKRVCLMCCEGEECERYPRLVELSAPDAPCCARIPRN